ncbi:hypothetical protein Tco_0291064, partial [Tanacetum coccineum]
TGLHEMAMAAFESQYIGLRPELLAALSRLSPDAVAKFLTPSLNRPDTEQGIATPSPAFVWLFFFDFGVEFLTKSGASDRPLILKKGKYVPWASRFKRFLENKKEEGELMQRSIDKGPYARRMVLDLENLLVNIPKPNNKMTEINKAQYFTDIKVLSKEDLKGILTEHGFKRAFMSLFGQDDDTFTSMMLLNFTLDYDGQMTDKYFVKYTGIEVKQFRETLLQHMSNIKKFVVERTHHQRQYDRRVNKRQMQTQENKVDLGKALDAHLVVTESSGTESGKQDTSSKSGNDTDADDADIRPIYDEELMAEVQLTIECNIFATGQQHIEQPEIINEAKTIEQITSLITQNADLKAQIQEMVFAIAALKNELRKNQSIVRQPTTFKSKRPKISKPRFASQVDVEKDLSKLVTQHYLPKGREFALAKPHHAIASSESRNSSKNMPTFSSNDMVHNHYLDEARKKIQYRDRNSKTSVMPSPRFQNTGDGSKPKPRSTSQSTRSLPTSKSSCVTTTAVPKADHSRNTSYFSNSKHFVCLTCQKCGFSENHDACITNS